MGLPYGGESAGGVRVRPPQDSATDGGPTGPKAESRNHGSTAAPQEPAARQSRRTEPRKDQRPHSPDRRRVGTGGQPLHAQRDYEARDYGARNCGRGVLAKRGIAAAQAYGRAGVRQRRSTEVQGRRNVGLREREKATAASLSAPAARLPRDGSAVLGTEDLGTKAGGTRRLRHVGTPNRHHDAARVRSPPAKQTSPEDRAPLGQPIGWASPLTAITVECST